MKLARAESPLDLLSPLHRAVTADVVAEEGAKREHVVVCLSGAHAYGFPSPESDLDLKAIHVAKTAEVLDLDPPPKSIDRAEARDGVDVDYTSNELAHALRGVLNGNGNFFERVLGRMVVKSSPLLAELRPMTERALSQRVYKHYRAAAESQLRALIDGPSPKKLLYVLRTTLTGVHALETGEIEADLTRLMERYGALEASDWIVRKRRGERVAVGDELLASWRPRLESFLERMDDARAKSRLPEEPRNEGEVRRWLLDVRRERFTGA